MAGDSAEPWFIGPVVVNGRGSSVGRARSESGLAGAGEMVPLVPRA